MFGTVGKLFRIPIFSACQIFEIGLQSRILIFFFKTTGSQKYRSWENEILLVGRQGVKPLTLIRIFTIADILNWFEFLVRFDCSSFQKIVQNRNAQTVSIPQGKMSKWVRIAFSFAYYWSRRLRPQLVSFYCALNFYKKNYLKSFWNA